MVLFVDVEMKQPRGSKGKKFIKVRERLSKQASGSAQWEIVGWQIVGFEVDETMNLLEMLKNDFSS